MRSVRWCLAYSALSQSKGSAWLAQRLPLNCVLTAKNKSNNKQISKITEIKPKLNSKSKPNTDTHTCLMSLCVCLSQKLMSMCKFHIHTIIVGLIDQLCVYLLSFDKHTHTLTHTDILVHTRIHTHIYIYTSLSTYIQHTYTYYRKVEPST